MPSKRTYIISNAAGSQRNSRSSIFCSPVALFLFICVLTPLVFLVSRVTQTPVINDETDASNLSSKQIDWREQLAMQHMKSLFTKEMVDTINAAKDDMGPWSLDYIRKNYLSSSWVIDGVDHHGQTNSTISEKPKQAGLSIEHEISQPKQLNAATVKNLVNEDKVQKEDTGNFQPGSQAKMVRRQLREKRREKRAMELVQQDDEATIRLENAAIERSKAVDSAVLGKYSIWRRDNENENSDTNVRLMRDQMIMARVYSVIAKSKNKLDLFQELMARLKDSQRALGDANSDSDLHHSAPEKIRAMGQVLSKSREHLYDCKAVTQKLRAMLQSADEQNEDRVLWKLGTLPPGLLTFYKLTHPLDKS